MEVDVFQPNLFLKQQLLSQCLEKVGVVREAEIASAVIVHPFAHLWRDAVCSQIRRKPKRDQKNAGLARVENALVRAACRKDRSLSPVSSSRPTWDVIQGTDGRKFISRYTTIHAADNLGSRCSREEFLLEVVYRELERVVAMA